MKVIPLYSGKDFRNSIFDILKSANANDEITANYFVLREDKAGLDFCHHLYQAARQGVKIKLIVDCYGSLLPAGDGTEYESKPLSAELIFCLEEIGIEVFIYHPITTTNIFAWSNIQNWENYSRRNHNKNFLFNLRSLGKRGLVIGDSQWADEHFNGQMRGSNLFVENDATYLDCFAYTQKLVHSKHIEKYAYGDLNIERIHSYTDFLEVPLGLHQESWNWYHQDNFIEPESIEFVFSDIEFVKPKLRHTIQNYEINLIQQAKEEIWYCTPYFSPDHELQHEFILAEKKHHLNLNILMAKFRHDPYLPYGVRRVARRLINYGINMFEYVGVGNIHYKDMIVDDMTFIKTANGEGRSRFYNLETGVIIKSKALADKTKEHIQLDIGRSVKIATHTEYLSEHPWWQRVHKTLLCPLYYHHL
jgi:phosphatidylserine/phosphatidylglycerophosphate/cardiolipin synthase-like enzyme